MMRLLRELDRADAGLPARGYRVRRVVVRLLTAAVTTTLVASVALSVAHKVWGVTLTSEGPSVPQPLSRPPQVETGIGAFTFMLTQPDDPHRPVTYDPCQAIEYQVNDLLAPPGTAGIVKRAVARISRATGLQFRYVGRTDRLPDYTESLLRPSREPVVIAWTTPEAVPELAGEVAGLGGSTPRLHDFSGDLEYVTGAVALDAPALHEILTRPEGVAQVGAIVIHELAHIVGLGHVGDPHELMYDDNAGQVDLGPGDREGLALLGSGRCYH